MKKRILSLMLAVLLILTLASCAEGSESAAQNPSLWEDASYTADTTLGQGEKEITVKVIAEEKSVTFTLLTDAENLGDALLQTGLAQGEDGAYGLYVKTVNGILADYDVDGSYWSFAIDGEAQTKGVSDMPIEGGEAFELIYTK